MNRGKETMKPPVQGKDVKTKIREDILEVFVADPASKVDLECTIFKKKDRKKGGKKEVSRR